MSTLPAEGSGESSGVSSPSIERAPHDLERLVSMKSSRSEARSKAVAAAFLQKHLGSCSRKLYVRVVFLFGSV